MIILGASGSIGANALEIAERYNLEVEVLGVGKNIPFLNAQILKFRPKSVIIADADDVKLLTSDFEIKFMSVERESCKPSKKQNLSL